MKINFDGANYYARIVTGIVSIDTQVDLYSDWKEWFNSGSGAMFHPMFESFGGNPLGGGRLAGDYYMFQNGDVASGVQGWRIVPWCGDYELTIVGNLYPVDTNKPIHIKPSGNCNVFVRFDTSPLTQTVEVGSAVLPEDKTEIAGLVWDEVLTGQTHNIPASAGRRVRELGDVITAQVNDPSPSVTGFITTLTSSYSGFYNDQYLRFIDGNLQGIVRIVDDYIPNTKFIHLEEPLPVAPANGDEFNLLPVHIHPMKEVSYTIFEELLDLHTTPDTYGTLLKVIEQCKEGNVSYQYIEALADYNPRNVASGVVDYIEIKYKKSSDSDWSSPVDTDKLYFWYKNKGDTDPEIVKEED